MKYVIWFVRFWYAAWMIPAGIEHFYHIYPQPGANSPHPLAAEMLTALLNTHLFDLVRQKQPQPYPNMELINEIITAIESDGALQTVSAVGNAFARSERGLQQLFQDYLGIGLKWLLQRRRLLAAAGQIRATEKPDWAAIAYDLGYSSQQHFITDFKQVLGKTPKQYKKGLMV